MSKPIINPAAMQEIRKEDSLIEYPCDFPIKVMGQKHPSFAQTMVKVVQQFAPEYDGKDVEMRASSGGTYIGLTMTIHVTNREQLDNIYRALSSHPMVKVVL